MKQPVMQALAGVPQHCQVPRVMWVLTLKSPRPTPARRWQQLSAGGEEPMLSQLWLGMQGSTWSSFRHIKCHPGLPFPSETVQ